MVHILQLIAWKDGENKLLIDPEEIKCLTKISKINDGAESIDELYADPKQIYEPGSVWADIVLSPSRANLQMELRVSIQKIENPKN